MGNTLPYVAPAPIGRAGIQAFDMKAATLAQNAVFRRGDLLQQITTGTIVNVGPNGAFVDNTPPPLNLASAVALSSSPGAPQQLLYFFYTWTDSGGDESQPSPEQMLVIPANNAATITVPDVGEPSGATEFNLYMGLLPGYEVQQVQGTALGSPATVPYPLTNYLGINRSVTDPDADIVGIAIDDFDVMYQAGPAAIQTNRSLFGGDVSGPPAGSYEQYSSYFYTLFNTDIQISLVQAWYPSLINQAVGFIYSSQYNTFAASTAAGNKIGYIVGKPEGPTNPIFDGVGGIGDTGARVNVRLTSGLI